jgi:hypothetical protein
MLCLIAAAAAAAAGGHLAARRAGWPERGWQQHTWQPCYMALLHLMKPPNKNRQNTI